MPDPGNLPPALLWKSMLRQFCKSQPTTCHLNLMLLSKSTPCPQKQSHKAKRLQRGEFWMCCSTSIPVKKWIMSCYLGFIKAEVTCQDHLSLETTVCQTWRFSERMVQTLNKKKYTELPPGLLVCSAAATTLDIFKESIPQNRQSIQVALVAGKRRRKKSWV